MTTKTTAEQLEQETKRLKAMQAEKVRLMSATNVADILWQQSRIVAALTRLQEVENAVTEFCNKSDWSAEMWKRQPHIAALFAIRDAVAESKQEGGE